MNDLLGPDAARIANRLCPALIAGLVIGRTDRPDIAVCGTSGTPRLLDERSIFEIGSLTKTMTGLLLADAVVRGELSLDDPLATWLPDAAPSGGPRPVTLLDVATHTAMLPANLHGFTLRVMLTHRANPFVGASRRDLGRAAHRSRPDARLGRHYAYSNVGFALLGFVLEAATGVPYATLLRDRLTTPLAMKDTTLVPPDDARDRLVVGHLTQRDPVEPFDGGVFDPAGGVRSTMRDLCTYARAMIEPERTPLAAAIRIALARHRSPVPAARHRTGMGLGWVHDDHPPAKIWHNGGAMGMGSWLGFRPDGGPAAVILINSGWRRVPLLTELGSAMLGAGG